MDLIGQILASVGALGCLICFILFLVKMFQQGATGVAIACIVLFFCCTIGHLIAFIYGWIKSGEWNLKNLMLIWTVCFLLWIVGNAMNQSQIMMIQQQWQGFGK
jgi:hypothetical protein